MPSRTSLSRLYDGTGQPIVMHHPVGHGKEGTVYLVQNAPSIVAKIFHQQPPPDSTQQKLLTMIANPLPQPHTRYFSIAWPISIITRTKRSTVPVGYTMPAILADDYHEIGAYFNPARRRELAIARDKPYTYLHLLNMAHNVCLATAHIHSHQHLVGDFNSRNILANHRGRIAIIDTDSFQIHDHKRSTDFLSNVGTPEYTPPSMQGIDFDQQLRTQQDDLFSLAVLIYQLIVQGQHPYNGIYATDDPRHPVNIADRIRLQPFVHYAKPQQGYTPPLHAHYLWTRIPLKRLFRTAFNNPHTRVPASTWADAIETATANMSQCRLNPFHYYFGKPCTWCRYHQMFRTDAFPKTAQPLPNRSNARRSRFLNSS